MLQTLAAFVSQNIEYLKNKNILRMSLKFQSFIFAFLAVAAVQQSCPNSILIQSYSSSSICNYQYQYINSTCSFKVCFLQPSKSSSSSSVGWKQCFSQCCDANKLSGGGDSVSLLYQCDEMNKSRDRLLIGLVVGLTFSLIGLIVLVIICWRMEQCPLFKWLEKINIKGGKKDDEVIEGFEENAPQVNDITLFQLSNKTQNFSQVKNYQQPSIEKLLNFNLTKNVRLMRSKCSICQDIKPDCYLTCNHYFHVKCIGLWLKDHKICASCGTKDLRYIHIFCEECREKIETISIDKFRGKLKKTSRLCCKACRHELQIDFDSHIQ